MFQTSAKSLSNLESCDFFVKIWKKSRHVQTGCFLSKFCFYSNLSQISKYSNLSHTFSCIWRTIPTIHLLTSYFPGHLCESESLFKSRRIFSSIFAKIFIYSLKMEGWNESGMIWMENIYGTKLRKALPNRRQIRSK